MNAKTHQMGGICSGIITSTLILSDQPLTPRSAAVCVVLVLGSSLGSLIPDIDKKNTKIRRMLNPFKKRKKSEKYVPFLTRWKQERKRQKERKRERRKPEALRHRGITHSPFFAMVLLLILLLIYPFIVSSLQPYYFGLTVGLFVGVMSHILVDAITIDGVPFLAPITYKKFRLMKFKTGRDEKLVSSLLVIMATLSVFYYANNFTQY